MKLGMDSRVVGGVAGRVSMAMRGMPYAVADDFGIVPDEWLFQGRAALVHNSSSQLD